MAIEFNIRIIGETAEQVMGGLAALGSRASSVLGVGAQEANPEAKTNGAEAPTPAKVRAKKVAAAPEPQPEPEPDRAGIIDGLTKIYGKGDPELRKRITEFRDERGADRLRDLKDEHLPAAAQLLVNLKLAETTDAP
jgi:hypothetical protein